MLKARFISLQLSLGTFAFLYTTSVLAQVTTDGTVNTQVNQDGNIAEITGGETRGGNLFHSFQDFSVPTGNEAFFNNADNISNIFSRVTGGNISNIDGAIRANGSASLFLINPAGIIFGENARLDIGGSFYGSSASSILFEDGEFSAVDNLTQPILTINAPIGLGFRDNPGDIVNRSTVRNSAEEVIGLEVNPGNNLTFVAGNLNFESGSLTASGGDIYLGAISESGTVAISENGSLSFAEEISRGDITLNNGSEIDVRGSGDGNITVDVGNLNLQGGESEVSSIRAGISEGATAIEAQVGDITINATGDISLNEGEVTNNVELEGVGNSGNILVTTNSLTLLKGSQIATRTLGQGNAGSVNVTATGDILADGENLDLRASGITSRVVTDAVGNSGGVTVSTNNLILTNGGRVDAGVGGQGNPGAVNVTATGDITIDGEISRGIPSQIASRVNPDSVGNAGEVTVSTNNLILTNGGRVDASTAGQGNAGVVNVTATGDITIDGERMGDTRLRGTPSGITSRVNGIGEGDSGGVTVSTNNLNLTNGGEVSASTEGQGNAGAVNVTATGDITVGGENSEGIPSGIISRVDLDAVGDAGGVAVSTNNLNLTAGGNVSASTLGQGNAGAVDVTATGDIIADGEGSEDRYSGIFSTVDRNTAERNNAIGNSGGVTISTNNLNLTAGGRVDASTFGRGNSGAVDVTATGNITIDGEASGGLPSGIFSTVDTIVFTQEERNAISQPAIGNSGGVTISTNNLNLTAGGGVDASTFAQGNAGAVDVTATGDITANGESSRGATSGITSRVFRPAAGDAGGVTISTTNLNLIDGGRVDASTAGQGNAGLVDVTATGNITIDGERASRPVPSGITSRVNQRGNGNSGGVTISTTNLNLSAGGNVDASTDGRGDAGAVNVTAAGDITIDGEVSDGSPSGITSRVGSNEEGEGDAGGVTISTTNLNLTAGGSVSATTFGRGNANNVTIAATESIRIDGFIEDFRSGISASALNQDGNGGGVFIETARLSVANGGTIEATNFDNIGEENPGTGRPGNINISANTIELSDNARIETATQFAGGESGIINLQVAENIILQNNSFISANARNNANGGNLNIDSRFTIAFPSNGDGNDIIANAQEGVGGNIQINSTLLGIQPNSATANNGSNDIDASSRFSLDGNITINTLNNDLIQDATELSTDVIVAEETIAQICQANRESAAQNSFTITGKGGMAPNPGDVLNSLNIYVRGESTSAKPTPAPVETAQGKIQPARGVEVTESGEVILTSYQTNNSGDRLPNIRNCG